jgi:cobalt/nickel transport system permease protein
MLPDAMDRYSRLDSPVHRAPPAVKLAVAFVAVVATAFLPRHAWLPLAGVLAVLLAAAAASRIPWRFLARRVLWLEPFALGVALLALLQPGGLALFGFLLARSTVCLFAMVLLAGTTPFADILRLLRRARVPLLLVTTLSLMYRYLFVLVDESGRMRRARASRTFERRRSRDWRTLATVAGQLFIRSTERADRIWAAMCARGWQ